MTVMGVLAAFGGGIFGAAIGALPAFEFVGFLVIAGVAVQLGVAPAATDFFGLPFGAFGPHVGGFASGVAAVAYAAKRGKIETGRNIVAGLMGLKSPDVLLVGGLFGIFGYAVQWGLAKVPAFGPGLAWTDTVALTVVLSAFVARLAFGSSGLFGKAEEGRAFLSPSDGAKWLSFQSDPGQLVTIGLGVGLFAGYLALTFGGAGVLLSFGIAAASLIFLQFGVAVPVSHHMALPAAIAAAASGSMIWAAVVGIVCAFIGELMARLFLCHGDTHIDPPAATIAIMTLVINFLTSVGFFAAVHLPV
ncbi:permease [Siculibacillus lacustris]|uniref:Permease n=1 Tax=Siculibacillus lacustris TaxID=1549641 RepID=A0A4Q9VNP3_9HYPH|nr:permease [Siculibacillus lacustris]TBW36778.1 permease [Siculibacillus lacustris]